MSSDLPATRIFLVRHGAVEDAWRGRIYGCHDVELSPLGKREAQQAASRLRDIELAAVISSGLRRTELGAACIRAERGLPRVDDAELREIERGAWVGLHPDETPDDGWRRWHAAPHVQRPPSGESLGDLSQRVLPRIAAHAGGCPGKALAIVAHSWVLRVTLCHSLGMPLSRASRLAVPTGSIAVIDWPNERDGSVGEQRPTLSALGADVLPPEAAGWYRSPRSR